MIEYLIGIHIPLPHSLKRKIQSLSTTLNVPHESYYGLQPHITLHLARIPKNTFNKLLGLLKKNQQPAFLVRLTSLTCDRNNRFLPMFTVQKVYKSPAIVKLHRQIVNATNNVRNSMIRTKDLIRIKNGLYTKKEIAHIDQYGYLGTMNNFTPHISVGTVDDAMVKDTKHQIVKRIQGKSKLLSGITFICNEIVVGLYPFDTKTNQFVSHKKIEKTLKLR